MSQENIQAGAPAAAPEAEGAPRTPNFTFHESVERRVRLTGSHQLLLALDDLVEIEDPTQLKEALQRVLANMAALLKKGTSARS